MEIAILGYGVVGSGAYEILTKNGYNVKKEKPFTISTPAKQFVKT